VHCLCGSATGFSDELWLLTHEDLVAVKILEQDSRTPGTGSRFTVESHIKLFHSPVVAKAIVGAQS
jgi:hypothetical protein